METRTAARDDSGFESNIGDGLAVDMLNPRATLVVKTRHSSYTITVIDGTRHLVLVDGGVFPGPTLVRLAGATFGGSAVKLGWIVVGLPVEFGVGPRRITSSPVQSIAMEPCPFGHTYQDKAA